MDETLIKDDSVRKWRQVQRFSELPSLLEEKAKEMEARKSKRGTLSRLSPLESSFQKVGQEMAEEDPLKKATETVREEEKIINYRRNFSDPKSPCFRLGFLNREITKGVIGDFLRPKRDYARSKGKMVENPEESVDK